MCKWFIENKMLKEINTVCKWKFEELNKKQSLTRNFESPSENLGETMITTTWKLTRTSGSFKKKCIKCIKWGTIQDFCLSVHYIFNIVSSSVMSWRSDLRERWMLFTADTLANHQFTLPHLKKFIWILTRKKIKC